MAKGTLAVYDPCHLYIERFLDYVNTKKNLPFRCVGFTDLNILLEQLEENKITVLLFSQDDVDKETLMTVRDLLTQKGLMEKMVLVFLGEQTVCKEMVQTWKQYTGLEAEWIEKYQSMENILSGLRTCAFEGDAVHIHAQFQEHINLAGIYSPADKTSHPDAAALAVRYLRRTKMSGEGRILYINLEQFSGMGRLMDHNGPSSLSDIIYSYRTNPARIAETMARNHGTYMGMDVLTAPEDPADLEEIGNKGWPDFIAALARSGDYQYIVFDISCFNDVIIEMILKYGNLFIPALPYFDSRTCRSVLKSHTSADNRDPVIAAAKLQEFRAYFHDRGQDELIKKILEVQLDTG